MMNTLVAIVIAITMAATPVTEDMDMNAQRARINNIFGYYEEQIVVNDHSMMVEAYESCMDMVEAGNYGEALEYAEGLFTRVNDLKTYDDWDYPELTLEEIEMHEDYIRIRDREDRYNELKYTREYITSLE